MVYFASRIGGFVAYVRFTSKFAFIPQPLSPKRLHAMAQANALF